MASNKVYASYQEIIDLHTEQDRVSVIGIHTPIGNTPLRMFKGLFEQFKKYKYKGCSISLVPAARLPADIEAVGNLAGEPNIDARDLLNPIMFHGCHGEDLGNILNRLYAVGSNTIQAGGNWQYDPEEFGGVFTFDERNDSALENSLENLYYKALVDNTWKKCHPQRGFRKSGLRPLVYSMATTHQLGCAVDGYYSPNGAGQMGLNGLGNFGIQGEPFPYEYEDPNSITVGNNVSKTGLQFLTPHLTGLGYLDTRTVLQNSRKMTLALNNQNAKEIIPEFMMSFENWTQMPLIYMGVILLPPAYKAEQYYRMIVNHRFVFKDFRGISMANSEFVSPSYFDPEHDIGVDAFQLPPSYPGQTPKRDEPELTPTNTVVLSSETYGKDIFGVATWNDANGDTTVITCSYSQGGNNNRFYGGFFIDTNNAGNGDREFVCPAIVRYNTHDNEVTEIYRFAGYFGQTNPTWYRDSDNSTYNGFSSVVLGPAFGDKWNEAYLMYSDSLDWSMEETDIPWEISIQGESKWKKNVTPEVSGSGSGQDAASQSVPDDM